MHAATLSRNKTEKRVAELTDGLSGIMDRCTNGAILLIDVMVVTAVIALIKAPMNPKMAKRVAAPMDGLNGTMDRCTNGAIRPIDVVEFEARDARCPRFPITRCIPRKNSWYWHA